MHHGLIKSFEMLSEPEQEQILNDIDKQLKEQKAMNIHSFKIEDKMTDGARSQWLQTQTERLKHVARLKYLKGQVEHDGDLGSVPLEMIMKEIENEAIDTMMYVAEMRRRFVDSNHVSITAAQRARIGELVNFLYNVGVVAAVPGIPSIDALSREAREWHDYFKREFNIS